jgi:uncharacterized protein (DUF1684 family)
MHGIQEVVGSISSSSTNEFKGLEGFPSKPFLWRRQMKWGDEKRSAVHTVRSGSGLTSLTKAAWFGRGRVHPEIGKSNPFNSGGNLA